MGHSAIRSWGVGSIVSVVACLPSCGTGSAPNGKPIADSGSSDAYVREQGTGGIRDGNGGNGAVDGRAGAATGANSGGSVSCGACLGQSGPWYCQYPRPSQLSQGSACTCGASGECPSGLVCRAGRSTLDSICVVPCDQDAGACGPGFVCNPSKRYCTACVTSADCGSASPFCSADGSCIQCLTDADCAGVLAGSKCLQNSCGCSASADCANSGARRQCGSSVLANKCVECDVDADCKDPARPRCDRDICRVECNTDSDCPASEPSCLGRRDCVECYDSTLLPCKNPAKPRCSWYLQCIPSDGPYL